MRGRRYTAPPLSSTCSVVCQLYKKTIAGEIEKRKPPPAFHNRIGDLSQKGWDIIMKKMGLVLCALLLAAVIAVPACAETIYDYASMSSVDREAILTNEEDILQDINTVLEAEQPDFVLEDVLTDEFVKIYVDTEIFELNADDQETIMEELAQGSYVYTCTAAVDDIRVEYTLALQDELDEDDLEVLTDEEIEELSENIGKWCVSSISVLEAEDECYTELVDAAALDGYDDVVLAGSLSGFLYPVAIGFSDGQAADVITLRDDSAYEIMEYIPETATADEEEHVYAFDVIKEIVQEQYPEDADAQDVLSGGGTGNAADSAVPVKQIVIIVVIVIAAVVILFGIRKKAGRKSA